MVLHRVGEKLRLENVPLPKAEEGELLVEVLACGVCRTDLHIFEGDLDRPKLPLILGHQIVGRVVSKAGGAGDFNLGERVGSIWLARSCGVCPYCLDGKENLCENGLSTGYDRDGGYAEFATINADYAFRIPKNYSDAAAAPLLCAGTIGYRALKLTELDPFQASNLRDKRVGLYGFGSSAHIMIQILNHFGAKGYAFTRAGDQKGQKFAKSLGAYWTGSSEERPPEELDSAIVFAPLGELLIKALKDIKKGGVVVSAGIHMSDIPSFPYELLWGERVLRSTANVTRQDGSELLELAREIPFQIQTTLYSLDQANEALDDLSHGRFKGAAVLIP